MGFLDVAVVIVTIAMLIWGFLYVTWWVVILGLFMAAVVGRIAVVFLPAGIGALGSIIAAVYAWFFYSL
jgi:hypothetical protein